jgi:hypothetical protein
MAQIHVPGAAGCPRDRALVVPGQARHYFAEDQSLFACGQEDRRNVEMRSDADPGWRIVQADRAAPRRRVTGVKPGFGPQETTALISERSWKRFIQTHESIPDELIDLLRRERSRHARHSDGARSQSQPERLKR